MDLHAGLVIPAGQRDRLERVCRYVLRPPVTSERLALTDDGQVRAALRQPWVDGTTHVVFDPVEFLGRLAVLVPRPRVNLIFCHGVLGARAAWSRARGQCWTALAGLSLATLGPLALEALVQPDSVVYDDGARAGLDFLRGKGIVVDERVGPR